MKKSVYLFVFALLGVLSAVAQTYEFKPIKGFQDSTNDRLEAFLESTVPMNTRKVAVFDCSGIPSV